MRGNSSIVEKKHLLALLSVLACFLLSFALFGCSSNSSEPDYADDEVIGAIADGLEQRWDVVDDNESRGNSQSSDSFAEATQAELDKISNFRDRQFEDSKLQEAVISYINKLEEMKQLTIDYPFDSDEFYDSWDRTYDERLVMIKNFVDSYGLEVDDAHSEDLSDLMADANIAAKQSATDDAMNSLVSSMEFEVHDEGYGSYTYSATVKNTSDFSFKNVSVLLSLYDSDGVMAEETSASVRSWAAGETVKFEAMGDIKPSQIKVSVDMYEVAD